MTEKMSEADKARLARNLRRRLPTTSPKEDVTLSNSEAANYMGGISLRTLNRISYPNDLDGPVPIRYSENGNVFWSKRDLDAYKVRKRIRLETNLMDTLEKRSLFTDLIEF
tara:strand:+ start:2259 stop:2591 length:333 start_codon:yes stop_codon:yes gene_type:complete